METLIARLDAWVIALTCAVAMTAFYTVGQWRGRRSPAPPGDHETKFTDASMALLGLLLAFTFSMALNRYDHRRLAAVADSNAIGDFYTSASVLNEPIRSRLQAVILGYARYKLEVVRESALETDPGRVVQQSLAMQAQATTLVAEAVAAGTPVATPLVNTLNEVTSSHAAYLAAYEERLPSIILLLLLLGSAIPAFLMGRQGASNTMHKSGPVSFGLLVTLVIYVTFDLNQPATGLIRMSQASLMRLIQSMTI